MSELLQDTFHEAVACFDRFTGNSEGELFVWLRQIMNGCAVTLARRYLGTQKRDVRREISLEDPYPSGALRDLIPDDELTPYSSTSAQERRDIVQQAFRRLNPAQQSVLQLRYGDGKTFPEIAALLGKSTKSVNKMCERGLKAWREALASLGVEEDT